MSGRNFSLTDHLSAFIDNQVQTGRHQNASEVVREALRRYQSDVVAEAADLAVIEKIAKRGIADIARGDFTLIHGADGAKDLLDRLNERVTRKAARPPTHG